jgi:hypothetical protein
MKIIRVFPRRTKATPDDDLVRIGTGPSLFDEADEIHISVAFSWDRKEADRLYRAWRPVAKTLLGGPATFQASGEFTPGLYLKRGHTITSRGCPNRCWFCKVWRREGPVRELKIQPGWKIHDDNLLACSPEHLKAVIEMTKTQPHRPEFVGGLEAARMTPAIAALLREAKPESVFFAYDQPAALAPLHAAIKMLYEAGFPQKTHRIRAYVLIGFPEDTIEAAEKRMRSALAAGAWPMAMLYRSEKGDRDPAWQKFQKTFCRPAATAAFLLNGKKRWEPAS